MHCLSDFLIDVRYGARSWWRTRGVASVAVVTIALAIGAITAIFSLLNVLVLRDLPVRDPASLVQFLWTYPGDPPLNMFSVEHYERYRASSTVFSEMLGAASARGELRAAGADVETAGIECVTGNFFEALGVRSARGRLFMPQDSRPGAAPVAVVSWAYWNERFAQRDEILGTAVTLLGDLPVTVVGVVERAFSGLIVGYSPDVWIPAGVCQQKGPLVLALMARLKGGVSIDRAQAEMRVLDRPRIEALAERDPQWRETMLDVLPARAGLSTPIHQQFVTPLWALMVVAGLVLVLACANVGAMMVARGAARQQEMAVRLSVGAGRSRLVRQMLTESLLLAAAGGVLGAGLAYAGSRVLLRILVSGTRMIGVPPRLDVVIDAQVLVFTAAVMMLAAVLFGLAPAAMAFASVPGRAPREGRGPGQPRSRRHAGNVLVAAQVALSLVLVTVAGLFVGHLVTFRDSRQLGFDPTSVLLVSVELPRAGERRADRAARVEDLLRRFESLPGVSGVTLSATTPISGAAGSRFVAVEGFEEAAEARRRVLLNAVAPGYFATLRTPLVAGRDFSADDVGRGRVVIVNEAMVRYYFNGMQPLGARLRFDADTEPHEIVGVVADAKYSDVRTPAPRTVYLHAFQQNRVPSGFVLRTRGSPPSVANGVRRIVDETMGDATITTMTTLREQVDASIVPERLIAAMSGFFGGTGLLLAVVGLYGLLAYTVARGTRELGVRMALGAQASAVMFLVLRDALWLLGAGVIVGVPLALWSTRIATNALGTLAVRALPVLAVAGLLLVAVGMLAAYVPARRATRIDPLAALRAE